VIAELPAVVPDNASHVIVIAVSLYDEIARLVT